MNVRLIFILLWLPLASLAQGFAGLGSGAEGFKLPETNPTFQFPSDDGSHPDFRIEWWYLTANLQALTAKIMACNGHCSAPHWPRKIMKVGPRRSFGWDMRL